MQAPKFRVRLNEVFPHTRGSQVPPSCPPPAPFVTHYFWANYSAKAGKFMVILLGPSPKAARRTKFMRQTRCHWTPMKTKATMKCILWATGGWAEGRECGGAVPPASLAAGKCNFNLPFFKLVTSARASPEMICYYCCRCCCHCCRCCCCCLD